MAITVTVQYSTDAVTEGVSSYPLRVAVTAAEEMSNRIFVMQSDPDAVEGDLSDSIFVKIATPLDLEEYPDDTPDPTTENPYYRIAEIILYFHAWDLLQEAKTLIHDAIVQLVAELKIAGNLSETEEVVYA